MAHSNALNISITMLKYHINSTNEVWKECVDEGERNSWIYGRGKQVSKGFIPGIYLLKDDLGDRETFKISH